MRQATGTHGPLIGKQEDGSFQTSKAKIYPIGLNTIISLEMFRFALRFVDSGTETELPEVFLPYHADGFVDRTTVQPDYHGVSTT